MATSAPAQLLRVADQRGVLALEARADLVHLGDDLALRGVWFGGERVEG
jgi:N-acetylglucosamine-6-phosphate deacetylase